jgi:acetyltransferase
MMTTLTAAAEPLHGFLARGRHPLDAIFTPKTVAVIGATETPGSVGRTITENLLGSPFAGKVLPVNPKRPAVLGAKAWPKIGAIPEEVDLAVIITPAATVPGIVGECAEAGVKGAIIISAGFKECGVSGAGLEQEILARARKTGMRLIGPNCLGVMRPHIGFNATFASALARPGKIAFISQSGALCTAILDWSFRENVGFSAFISVGSMLDVGWGDLIYYLGNDPHTESIVIYMEAIGDAKSFLSAAREVALSKPIIVIKVGRTEAAAQAAASHTGSLTGSDDVLEAAFRRAGVLRVNTIAELFDMAEVLGKQPRPKGPRLAIVTNAGGPSALATDMLISSGGQLAPLSPESFNALNKFLPAHWSRNNPIDILGDADAEQYAKAVSIAAKDPNNDGLLVILTPQAMTDPTGTAAKLKSLAKLDGKPILASWMGGPAVAEGNEILNQAGIPTFDYPDTAARAFQYMWRYSCNLRSLYETPALMTDAGGETAARSQVEPLIQKVRKAGRTLLTEHESKQVLKAYGIPTVETHIAGSEEQAVEWAAKLGYPVVLKLHSETITHKTDVGGVRLNLRQPEAVRSAWREIEAKVNEKSGPGHFLGVTVQPMVKLEGYELILGSSLDPQFGPVLLFGAGGQLVEVLKDSALGLPPLNATLARRMMEQTHIYSALKGVRGRKAADLAALERLLVRFSQLVAEQGWIKEIDINPLLASPDGFLALDARIVLHGQEVTGEQLPRLAIRPYPTQYVSQWMLGDGTGVNIRPIRPEDENLMPRFHERLSDDSVYFRYQSPLDLNQRVTHERLTKVCFNDYERELALVVEHKNARTNEQEILGIGRLIKSHAASEAEFALVVIDSYQDSGLGKQLLRRLVHIARAEGVARIFGYILPGNGAMLHISDKLGFRRFQPAAAPLVKVELDLRNPPGGSQKLS